MSQALSNPAKTSTGLKSGRVGLVLAACLALTGCVGSVLQPPVAATAQASTYRFVDIDVEAAPAVARDDGFRFNSSEAQVEALVGNAALDVLTGFDDGGTRDVRVNVVISRLFVPSVASAALTARGAAAMGATVLLSDARTGAPIGTPFGLRAHDDNRLGGVIGAVLVADALAQGGERGEIATAGRALGFEIVEALYQIDPRTGG